MSASLVFSSKVQNLSEEWTPQSWPCPSTQEFTGCLAHTQLICPGRGADPRRVLMVHIETLIRAHCTHLKFRWVGWCVAKQWREQNSGSFPWAPVGTSGQVRDHIQFWSTPRGSIVIRNWYNPSNRCTYAVSEPRELMLCIFLQILEIMNKFFSLYLHFRVWTPIIWPTG